MTQADAGSTRTGAASEGRDETASSAEDSEAPAESARSPDATADAPSESLSNDEPRPSSTPSLSSEPSSTATVSQVNSLPAAPLAAGGAAGEPNAAASGQGGSAADGAGGNAAAGEPSHSAAGAGGEANSDPTEKGIRIEQRILLVDGQPFQIRGVNWNPVPKGGTHPDGLDYAGLADQDIALMKAAGINVVRTYERLEDPEVLDKLYAAGIRVFSTVYGWWQDSPSVVTERVNAAKDHPAILAWVLGNEWNYNKLYGNDSLSLEQARDQINEAAALIKAADPNHPVASIYGELGGLAEMVQAMPDIDLWGINAYRGISFGDLFAGYEAVSDKPMFLGEYGADAFNANLGGGGGYDPDSQAQAVGALTQELLDHSSLNDGVAAGGFIFEWADEWWKVNGGDASVQDNGGVAPGGGPYPDSVFNEEWWGIVDIDRNPRPAYDALVDVYAQ